MYIEFLPINTSCTCGYHALKEVVIAISLLVYMLFKTKHFREFC